MKKMTLQTVVALLSVSGLASLQARAQVVVPISEKRAKLPASLDREERTNVSVFQRASPSVVSVCTKAALTQRTKDGMTVRETVPKGTGTGFIWDSAGHVVTNFHVIQGADRVQVTLANGRGFTAKIVGVAPEFDIAILKIDVPGGGLRPLSIGKSQTLLVGQKVFAIGNPFGLDHTLTTGIISGLGREIQSPDGVRVKEVIQTDAAINPGNSGGPLLDNQGSLIGINTAILSPSGSSAGIGFAVPVDTVRRAVPQLIKHGRIAHVGLGASFVPDQIASRLGLIGAVVFQIANEGPAKSIGLKPTHFDEDGSVIPGDAIVAVDGEPIATQTELREQLYEHKSGDIIALSVQRATNVIELKVKLETAT